MRRLLPYAAGYALLHGLMVAAGFYLSAVPEVAVSIWPAVGLLCAVLAVTRRRTWPLWILASFIGRVVFELLIVDNRTFALPLLFSSINAVEALIFAVFVQRPLINVFRHGRPLYLATALMVLAIVAANVGGLLGASAGQRISEDGPGFLMAWRLWAAGDFVGILLVTPLAVWQMMPQLRVSRAAAGLPELAAMPVLLLLVLMLAIRFTPDENVPFATAVEVGLAFLVVLPVLWAALRAEFRIVAMMQLLMAVAVVVTSAMGLGPLGHTTENYVPALAALQLFMVVSVLFVTIVTSAVLEKERAERDSSLHQKFSDLLVQLTGKMISAGSQSLDETIVECLRLLADFANADRCVLMQMDSSGLRIGASHAWQEEGVSPLPAAVTNANLAELPWAAEQIRTKGFIILHDMDKGLPKGAEELEAMRSTVPDTVDAIYIGLFAEKRIIGFIGYGYVRRNVRRSNEAISLMYLVGQMFANILQRKKMERDLESYRDSLRGLAAEMALTEERARRRTAIDLHDGIGQNLAVARMKIGQALAAPDSAPGDLVQARNLIDDALRGTRFIISDLSPSILYELGLEPALQALAERFEPANDLSCSVEVTGVSWSPGNDLRISLYRAVQECLNNVARHAQAQSVAIRLCWEPDQVSIDVVDDGVGFEVNEYTGLPGRRGGFGLFSMRENLALLGGRVDIESARGLGTTVHISVPRSDQEEGA